MKVKWGGEISSCPQRSQLRYQTLRSGRVTFQSILGCGSVAGRKNGGKVGGKCPAVCIRRLHFRIRKMSCYYLGQTATVSRTFVWRLMLPRYVSVKGQPNRDRASIRAVKPHK